MRYIFKAVVTAAVASVFCTTTTSAQTNKPNILVIWGDDIGITNLSCYSDGLMGYRTPNIDRIAAEGVRFDSMLYQGYTVPPFYDSLLGKLIVHDKDRASAIRRLDRALAELSVEGLATTKTLHQALARDPDVQAARFHTAWLEPWLETHAASLTTVAPSSQQDRTMTAKEPAPPATGGR